MVYLIDYENVGDNVFSHINTLSEEDKIVVFYNANTSKLSFTSHRLLEKSVINREYISINTGTKNALDFQLATYLGYLIANDNKTEYCIVSKDNGFDVICNFWKSRGAKVTRSNEIAVEKPKSQEKSKKVKLELETALSGFSNDSKGITTIINESKSKQEINNKLVKKYGSEKAGKIYKIIKPFFVNKK